MSSNSRARLSRSWNGYYHTKGGPLPTPSAFAVVGSQRLMTTHSRTSIVQKMTTTTTTTTNAINSIETDEEDHDPSNGVSLIVPEMVEEATYSDKRQMNGSKHLANEQETTSTIVLEENEKNQRSGHMSIRSLAIMTTLTTAAVLLVSSWPNFVSISSAIDHPVDHALLGIPTSLGVGDVRFFVSGGVCAAASHGITTPVDVVKTRMQTDPSLQQSGLVAATLTLWQNEGPATLLQGLGPTVVGYGVEGALKFGLYESMKPVFADLLHTSDIALPYLLASVAAGAVASIVLCPMEQLRIRAVTDPEFGMRSNGSNASGGGGSGTTGGALSGGMIGSLTTLMAEGGGIGSLFRGLPCMLSKQVPYTYGKQCTFDEFASFLYTVCENSLGLVESQIKYEVSVAAAFLASMVACVLSHPGDVILTYAYKKKDSVNEVHQQQQSPEQELLPPQYDRQQQQEEKQPGLIDIVQRIYDDQGLEGFVTGLSARLVHVGVIVTSQLVLYDFVKQLLGLPATGSH